MILPSPHLQELLDALHDECSDGDEEDALREATLLKQLRKMDGELVALRSMLAIGTKTSVGARE